MNAREVLLGGVSAIALGAALVAAPVGEALAQSAQGTIVTQSASKADAATWYAQSLGGRTSCSTTQETVANLTITITPPAGNFVYLTGMYIEGGQNAGSATSATVWSSTNLTGLNGISPAWATPTVASAAANPTNYISIAEVYPTGMKSTVAGTPVTILPQATSASAILCAHAVGFFNPS